MKEHETYKGYKIEIKQDQYAENPFEAWDFEPPLIAFYGGRHSEASYYQDAPESWWDILRMLPPAFFNRKNRMAFLREFILPLGLSLRDFAEERQRIGEVDAIATLLGEYLGEKPQGWRAASEWLEMAESLLKWGGIECLNTQSNGYSQGDSTLLLVIASPKWLEQTGIKAEHVAESLQASADLYGAWVWGDVYGISAIYAPNEEDEDAQGEKISEGSCWGFYGRDHEKSGLMEHARSAIDWHLENKAQTALNEPACLI
jgi:hypothetical protein